MQSTYKQTYKVIIVGSSGVGKSSLLLRFTDNAYETTLLATIGVDFKFKTVTLSQGEKIKLQIWDTAGSQSFRAIVSAYYRGADAVIMVYSATDRATWNDMKQFWINQLNKYKSQKCRVYIFENKIDLLDEQSRIDEPTDEEIKEFMDKQDIIQQFQVSAKTGQAVNEAFLTIAEQLNKNIPKKEDIEKQEQQQKEEQIQQLIQIKKPKQNEKTKQKGCCK